MESALSIYQSIISRNNDYLEVYMNELGEHQVFDSKSAVGVVQHISSTLSKSQTYHEGLVVLNSFLQEAPLSIVEQKATLWTTLTLKVINCSAIDSNTDLAYLALITLASMSSRLPEISKSFANNHLSRVYESFNHISASSYLAALKCAEVCLSLYPGQSGPFRGTMEKFLTKFLDSTNEDLNIWSGKCMHLLQQVRGGGIQGISHKAAWLSYQEALLRSLHNVLDLAFSNCNEFYDKLNTTNDVFLFPDLKVDTEPTKRMGQLFIRFRNLVNYLIIALRHQFPVAKPVAPKKILNLITRGLNVTCPLLQKNPTTDNLTLGVVLPRMHLYLLDLLKTLIVILRSNLKMYHHNILGLIMDTLGWTSRKLPDSKMFRSYSSLRSKAYEVLSLWCNTLRNGSRIELHADTVLEDVIFDISPTQNDCTLQVLSGPKRHMSQKARRQLHKARNEQSNLSQLHTSGRLSERQKSIDEKNRKVCVNALKCLQEVLVSAANFLKPTLIKMIHLKVMQICAVLYELPTEPQDLYSHWECRLEIYKVMLAFVTQPHPLCPPPMQMTLHVLKIAQLHDKSVNIRRYCNNAITQLENILHPRRESLLFPVDIRDIRNNFIKFGKEHLLTNGISNDELPVECNSESDAEMTDSAATINLQTNVTSSHLNSTNFVNSNENYSGNDLLSTMQGSTIQGPAIAPGVDEDMDEGEELNKEEEDNELNAVQNNISVVEQEFASRKRKLEETENDSLEFENDNLLEDKSRNHANPSIDDIHQLSLSNKDDLELDDDIIAELEAAFVDELD